MHVCGIALIFLSAAMFLCSLVGISDTSASILILISALITAFFGFILWRRTELGETDQANIFSAVGWTWLIISIFGSLPYLFLGTFGGEGVIFVESLVDSLFESVSGFSCTGSTVFGAHNPIETQSIGILFYRQMTQWLGGMGIVVLVVTVLPSLRAGGLGLIDAEAPGAGVDRLAPRVVDTAKKFWSIYLSLTLLVSVALLLAGMSIFDSISHGLSTASTGGFSTKDSSIGHWDSISIEIIIIGGLLIGAANFTLHARSIEKKRILHFSNPEFRGYFLLAFSGVIIVASLLLLDGFNLGTALRSASFNVVTLISSGGFGNARGAGSSGDFASWNASPQLVLFFFLIFGGCTGSTAGGVKIIRLRIGLAHTYRTMRAIRRPRALLKIRIGKNVIPDSLVERIAGFVVVYGVLVVAGTLILTMLGSDLLTSLTGVFSALGNMGPGLGEIGPSSSFHDGFSAPARLVLAIFMLIGRLEIFPLFLMLVLPYRFVKERTDNKNPTF